MSRLYGFVMGRVGDNCPVLRVRQRDMSDHKRQPLDLGVQFGNIA